MKNTSKTSSWASSVALTRYDAVRYVQEAVRSGLPLSRALLAASQRTWDNRLYKVSTIERWYYRYRQNGFEDLAPQVRNDKGKGRKLSAE